jgi:membrane AbrB-like protein
MADDLGADDRVVAILQYLRLLAVLVTLPIVVIGVFGVSAERADASTQASPLPTALVFVAASVAIGLPLGRLARLPSAALLGPLTVASILGLFPVFSDPAVPDAAADVGYVLIGVHVGLRFTVRSLLAIGRMLPVALLTIAVTLGACGGLAWVLVATTGVSGLDAYLATTPGGIYAVTGTAAAVSGDVTFVTATQVLRLLIILVSAPLLAVWLRSDRCSGGAPDGLAPRA